MPSQREDNTEHEQSIPSNLEKVTDFGCHTYLVRVLLIRDQTSTDCVDNPDKEGP